MKIRKRGVSFAFGPLVWWIIGLIVLVLVVIGYFILSDKAGGALEFIKNAFRFRS